jgi:hypothetical protein
MANCYPAELEVTLAKRLLDLDPQGELRDLTRPFAVEGTLLGVPNGQTVLQQLNDSWSDFPFDEVGVEEENGVWKLTAMQEDAHEGIAGWLENSILHELHAAGLTFLAHDNGGLYESGSCVLWRPGMEAVAFRCWTDGITMDADDAKLIASSDDPAAALRDYFWLD